MIPGDTPFDSFVYQRVHGSCVKREGVAVNSLFSMGLSASRSLEKRRDSIMNHDMEIPCFFIFLTTLGWLMPRYLAISRVERQCARAFFNTFIST